MEISAQYRFDTFAEGESSRLAFAAANAVANGDHSFGNPLVLIGGTGIGKTHLLHSIVNSFEAKNENLKIICITALEFYEEYSKAALQKKDNHPEQMDEMSAKFRHADALVIDDLQNIENKINSQQELLQIFNTLLLAGKPIVAASQIPVSDIESLNESLRSRLTGGLSIVVSSPTLVDRLAILRKKFDMIQLNIEEDVLHFLAENTSGTARDLEGIVSTLSFRVRQSNKNADIEMAGEILEEHFVNSHRTVSVENLVKAITLHYGIPLDILKQKSRGSKEASHARQVAMYLIRNIYKKSFEFIGKYFNKDSSTVIYACKAVDKKIQKEIPFKLEIERIKKSLHEQRYSIRS
jgi:chromosomal replication initiator protein